MPIYEYECEKCSHQFEREQRITEDPIKTCPACKARKARRLISRTSFVLKGGGWYNDLYSSPGAAKKDAGEGKDDAGSGAKGDGKSDGKGDSKGGDAKSGEKGGTKGDTGSKKGTAKSAA